jgi:hypothetical protein
MPVAAAVPGGRWSQLPVEPAAWGAGGMGSLAGAGVAYGCCRRYFGEAADGAAAAPLAGSACQAMSVVVVG